MHYVKHLGANLSANSNTAHAARAVARIHARELEAGMSKGINIVVWFFRENTVRRHRHEQGSKADAAQDRKGYPQSNYTPVHLLYSCP